MAKKSNDADSGNSPAKKGGSMMGLILPVVLLTVLAAGGGGLIGLQILAVGKASATADAKQPAMAAALGPNTEIRELSPVVTNLSDPNAASWVRLQTAVAYDKADQQQIDVMSAKISDDMLAYVRTLTLAQLQGASGLQHLREDLNERASIRSDGHIKELMIEMLVIQ